MIPFWSQICFIEDSQYCTHNTERDRHELGGQLEKNIQTSGGKGAFMLINTKHSEK